MSEVDEQFQVADTSTKPATIDALNTSFNSISAMIDDYVPYSTSQDFAILSYSGYVVKDEKYGPFTKPAAQLNVFGVVGASYWLVGTLDPDGYLTANITQNVVINQPYRI